MTYSYQFANLEETFLRRTGGDEEPKLIPAVETNRFYREFLASGQTPSAYVAEPEATPAVNPLEVRIAALESNEIIDDAVDTSLLSLMASASSRLDSIEARLAALEGGN